MKINGQEVHGRPIEFDSEIVDFNNVKNAFGNFVRPKKLSTVCPDCGAGLEVVVTLPDPPFPVIEHSCPYCNPSSSLQDPFQNPVASKTISEQELDPLLHDISKDLESFTTSVSERLPVEQLSKPTPVEDHYLDSPVDDENDIDQDLVGLLEGQEDTKEAAEDTKEREIEEKPPKKRPSKSKKKTKKSSSKPKPEPQPEPLEEEDEEEITTEDLLRQLEELDES